MTAQARKLAPVAYRAGLLVEARILAGVSIENIPCVVRRPKLRARSVAKSATVGRIDLVVAHQAIRHLRHIGLTDFGGFGQASMTGLTDVVGVQKASSVTRRRQVGAAVDGIGDHGSDISQLQMCLVAKRFERRFTLRRLCGEQRRKNGQRDRYPLV